MMTDKPLMRARITDKGKIENLLCQIKQLERYIRELDDNVASLQEENERLKKMVGQAFDAIDNRDLVKGPKHFTRYPCECGEMVSNNGHAAASHRRGSIHRQNMERKALGLPPA